MHWVYVLLSESGDIYVGETTRLFRRWNEHQTGRGGVNTSMGEYNTVIGLYNVASNRSFAGFLGEQSAWSCERYWENDVDKSDALFIENLITERYMVEKKCIVRGGRYTTEKMCRKFSPLNHTVDRPLCKCGYPCEVNMKKDKTKIYFTCPIPTWVEDVPEKCNFWEEYTPFRLQKDVELRNRQKQWELWVAKLPMYNGGPCMKCKSDRYRPIWSRGEKYSICEGCFNLNYEALKKEYQSAFLADVFAD